MYQIFFPRLGKSRTRGHCFKVHGEILNRYLRATFFFIEKVVGVWNELAEEVVEIEELEPYSMEMGPLVQLVHADQDPHTLVSPTCFWPKPFRAAYLSKCHYSTCLNYLLWQLFPYSHHLSFLCTSHMCM